MASKRDHSRGVPRDLALVVAGRFLSLGALFGSSIVIARTVGPAEYGLYSTALGVTLLLDALLGGTFDNATVRFGSLHRDEPGRVDRLMGASARLRLGAGVVALALVPLIGTPVASLLFDRPGRTGLLGVAVLSALGLMALRSTAAALQVRFRFGEYARLDAMLGGLRIVATLGLALAGARAAAPYVGIHGAAAALTFLLGLWLIPQPQILSPWPERADLRALVAYSGVSSAAGVFGTISARADVLTLAATRLTGEVGQYAAALQLATVVTLAATFVAIVTQPRIIPLAQQGKLRSMIGWNLLVGIGAGLPAVLAAVWLAPVLVPLLFGAAYEEAASLLQVLLLGTFLDLLGVPLVLPTAVLLFPRSVLVAEALTTTAFLATAPMVARNGGALGMAWLMVVIRLVKLHIYLGITLLGLRRAAEPVEKRARS